MAYRQKWIKHHNSVSVGYMGLYSEGSKNPLVLYKLKNLPKFFIFSQILAFWHFTNFLKKQNNAFWFHFVEESGHA